jgi:glutamate synthase domain-containing protein 1
MENQLGALLERMLSTMCERGPDSAGFAVYGHSKDGQSKITLQSANAEKDFADLKSSLAANKTSGVTLDVNDTHAVLRLPTDKLEAIKTMLADSHPSIRIMATGDAIEIYKEVGYPNEVAKRFDLKHMTGTHAIGHTRMATESDVDIRSAHPYWAYPFADVSVVHNGQLTNYWKGRRALEHRGHRFMSNCDSELIAVYLADKMQQGAELKNAMKDSIEELDGVFTYVVATSDSLGMAKDTMAAKPMVLYESDDFIALASEEVAIRSVFPHEIDTFDPYEGEVRVWKA